MHSESAGSSSTSACVYGIYSYRSSTTIKGGTITARVSGTTSCRYSIYFDGASSSHVLTIGEQGGVPSKTNPEIISGIYSNANVTEDMLSSLCVNELSYIVMVVELAVVAALYGKAVGRGPFGKVAGIVRAVRYVCCHFLGVVFSTVIDK